MGDDPSKEAASTEAPPAQPVATPPHPKEKAGWSPSGIGVLSLLCDPVAITSILAWSRARRWLRAVARREAAGVWAPDHVALRTNAAWGVALGLVRPGALLLVACFGLGAGLEALAARALPVDREREAAERLGLASVESDEVLRELLRGDADRRRQAAADLRAIAEEGYEDLPAAEVLSALRRLAHGEPAGPGSPALDDEEEGRALAGSLLGALAAASQRHGGSTWPELARELAAQPLPPLGDQAERDTLVLLLACGKGPASACGDPWSGSLRATIEGLLGRAPGWRGADGAPLGLPVLTLEGLHRGRPVVGRRLLSYEGHGLVAAQGLAVVTSYCEANGRGAPRPRGDPPESDLPEDRAWLAELAPPVIAKRVDALAPRLASPETRLSALREAKTLARLSSCVEGLDEGLVRFAELGREDEAVDWIVADTRAQLGGPLPAPEDKARLAARDVSRAPLWRLLWDRDRLDGFPLAEAQPTPLMTSAVIERLTWSETPELPDLPRPVRRAADVGPGMVDRGGDRSTFTVPLEGGYVAHAVFSGSVEALEEAARQRDAVGLVDGVVVEVCRAPGPDWACPDDAAIAVLRPLDRRLSARARGVDG